jgi:hypothetical protein
MTRTKPADNWPGFNTQLKTLINQHFKGDIEPAARSLGVSPTTLKGWVKGTRIPGYERQTQALRKLRSL